MFSACIQRVTTSVPSFRNDCGVHCCCCGLGKAMDYGYHVSLAQVMMVGISAEQHTCRGEQDSLALLSSKTNDLNQREDRQAFLQQHHQIFSLPKKFEFQPHKDDSVCASLLHFCTEYTKIMPFI